MASGDGVLSIGPSSLRNAVRGKLQVKVQVETKSGSTQVRRARETRGKAEVGAVGLAFLAGRERAASGMIPALHPARPYCTNPERDIAHGLSTDI